MSKLLEELVSDIIISGEEISTTLTINGSPSSFTDYHWEAMETEIDITRMEQGLHQNLRGMPAPLIQYFFSRPYRELPTAVRQEGGIYIPSPGDFQPIVRDQYLFYTKPPVHAFHFIAVRERKG